MTARIGLVIGAGGSAGGQWIRGAFDGLAERHGFRPEHSSVTVGTSIGAIIAARIGPPTPAPPEVVSSLSTIAEPPSSPALTSRLLSPGRRLGGRLAAMVGPAGPADPTEWVHTIHPESVATVVSVRRRGGTRRSIPLVAAPTPVREVAASAAVPFGAKPVVLDDQPHIDGALWSVTNADLVTPDEAELLVVIAPLVASDGGSLVSALGRHQLATELAPWRRAGRPVVVIAPSGAEYRRRQETERHRQAAADLVLGLG